MAVGVAHVSVCICTFKRPVLLRRLLLELDGQVTEGLFSYSIVVVDNDHRQSGKATVLEFATSSKIAIKYCVEPRQNIPMARNRAVENAQGDFIAFIDDDEFPVKNWLLTLLKACSTYDVDGVQGPVRRHFDEEPPKWIKRGKFYERPTYPTGLIIDWTKGRTNNLLLKKKLFSEEPLPFKPEFVTGEDQDFIRRMINKGHRFVWCDEAVVHEVVPPIRWKRSFMLRRALLQGSTSTAQPTFGFREVIKAVLAVPAYTAVLPFALIFGQHRFMDFSIKLFHHLGTLLSCLGINIIREPYVTE